MLNGQKLQGTGTSQEVYQIMKENNMLDKFPLFTMTYQIAFEGKSPEALTDIAFIYGNMENQKLSKV